MEKTVKYQGKNIKVEFEKIHIDRTIDEADYKENLFLFKVCGKGYDIASLSRRGKSGKFNVQLRFEGIIFPDSEKKVVEYIINKYGY